MSKLVSLLANKKLWAGLVFVYFVFLVFYFFRAYSSSSTLKVYFLKDEKLAWVKREIKNNLPMLTMSKELIAGPTKDEQQNGYYTEIPKYAEILNVKKKNDVMVVDFNAALESYGGGASRVQALVGQIVYSFTELPGIRKVKITVNGENEVVLGGEGFVIDKPLSRNDIAL